MMTEIVKTNQAMTLNEQLAYANTICKGSLVPNAYRNSPANVLIAMGFGQAMGLSAAESLYRITVINGKPSASAELVAANVRRAGHKLRIKKDEQAQQVSVEIIRADDPDYTFSSVWTMDRAAQAGLTGKDNWKKYPLAMLTARAITECARDACSEALYGVVYTGEEMGASNTDQDGYISAVEAPSKPVEAPVYVEAETIAEQPQQAAQEAVQTPQEYQEGIALGEAQARVGNLMREAKAAGFYVADLNEYARENYQREVKDLSAEQLNDFAGYIERLMQYQREAAQEIQAEG